MEQLLEYLTSPSWWFSVIIAGTLVSVAGSYVRNGLDVIFAELSTHWKLRVDLKKAALQSEIEELIDNPVKQQRYLEDEFRARLSSANALGLVIVCALIMGYELYESRQTPTSEFHEILVIIFGSAATCMSWIHNRTHNRAIKLNTVLVAARDLSKHDPGI